MTAAWSPSRPGLLMLATSAGSLEVWDLLDRSHEPSIKISASNCAITSIAFSNSPPKHFTHGSNLADTQSAAVVTTAAAVGGAGGPAGAQQQQQHQQALQQPQQQHQHGSGLQVLAVGDAAGVLHLFELPRTLRRPLQNEKRLMEAFVAREAARVADVASRQVSKGSRVRAYVYLLLGSVLRCRRCSCPARWSSALGSAQPCGSIS